MELRQRGVWWPHTYFVCCPHVELLELVAALLPIDQIGQGWTASALEDLPENAAFLVLPLPRSPLVVVVGPAAISTVTATLLRLPAHQHHLLALCTLGVPAHQVSIERNSVRILLARADCAKLRLRTKPRWHRRHVLLHRQLACSGRLRSGRHDAVRSRSLASASERETCGTDPSRSTGLPVGIYPSKVLE